MKPHTFADVLLALAPTSRGFGFVAFDADRRPLDWGVKEVRKNKQDDCYLKARVLIHVMQPSVVVLETAWDPHSRRSRRVKDLIDRIGRFAQDHGVTVRQYTRRDVAKFFRPLGARNKDEIASAVARLVPELAPRQPRRRRIWESEHYSMGIFEAAALALTHFGLSDVTGGTA